MEEIASFSESTMLLPATTKLPELAHIPDDQIVIIRFIRSVWQLDIFSKKFTVPKELVYTYLKAIIDTSVHILAVYQGAAFVIAFEYNIPSKEGVF